MFFAIMAYSKILNIVPCAVDSATLLFIYFYILVHIC